MQLISGVVLIVGVILVLVQLQQNERLAQMQIMSDWISQRAAQAGTAAGESPMLSFAKLCDSESELTLEDAAVLHAFFQQRFFMGLHGRMVFQRTGGNDADDWKGMLQTNMNLVISTEQGRAWFETLSVDDETSAAIKASNAFDDTCAEMSAPGNPLGALLRTDADVKARMRMAP